MFATDCNNNILRTVSYHQTLLLFLRNNNFLTTHVELVLASLVKNNVMQQCDTTLKNVDQQEGNS